MSGKKYLPDDMVTFTLKLPRELKEKAHALARLDHRSLTDVLRQKVREWVEEQEAKKVPSV